MGSRVRQPGDARMNRRGSDALTGFPKSLSEAGCSGNEIASMTGHGRRSRGGCAVCDQAPASTKTEARPPNPPNGGKPFIPNCLPSGTAKRRANTAESTCFGSKGSGVRISPLRPTKSMT